MFTLIYTRMNGWVNNREAGNLRRYCGHHDVNVMFWLDPFHIYSSYQATSEGVLHVQFLAKFQNLDFWQYFKICSFDFVLFWLGIWFESLVWVIKGQRGVSQSAGILLVLVKESLRFGDSCQFPLWWFLKNQFGLILVMGSAENTLYWFLAHALMFQKFFFAFDDI